MKSSIVTNHTLIHRQLTDNSQTTHRQPNSQAIMTMSVTYHDLTSKERKYLEEMAFIESLKRNPEEEVLHSIDCIQSSREEKKALHDLVTEHMLASNFNTEWVNEEINIGSSEDFDNYRYWTQLLDEAEMNMDMNTDEDEQMCHQLFANNPWEKREFCPSTMVLTKKSHFVAWAEVTHIGESYTTGESDYGKVFIPNGFAQNHGMEVGDYCLMTIAFKGFESSRTTTMPWRSLKVHKFSKP